MVRERPRLGIPFGTDGPWLAAILDVLGDLYDLLDARLPQPEQGGEPVRVEEPAPPVKPGKAVPIQEPAPTGPPERDDEDEDGGPVEVTEPAAPVDPEPLPAPPPRAGRGSSLPAWQAFADLAQVTYIADDRRDDIIDACVAAGVIPDEQ